MDTTAAPEYKAITVTGPVTVDKRKTNRDAFNILIMGPTGAGKSSFIEALGLNSAEKISSGRLEGFTQSVSTYRLNNVKYLDRQIYLVDSPGFADTKISEMTIVSMLQQWIRDTGYFYMGYFQRILYLTPITSVRVPGSQRNVLKTFHELTGVDTLKQITITTTMWDLIWGESAEMRAKRTFQQLENDVWKRFIDQGARIVKFHNTQASALSIIDGALSHGHQPAYFAFEDMVKDAKSMQQYTFVANLKADLQDHIQNLQSAHAAALSDLEHAISQDDMSLQRLLRSSIKEMEDDLKRFKRELHKIDYPGRVSQGIYAIKLWAGAA